MDSFLFKKAQWKVSFSNDFLKSMSKVENAETCKEVLTLLENLANGLWLFQSSSTTFKSLVIHHLQLLEISLLWGEVMSRSG
nr:hypothetical protein CFP56_60329 [Quercus suber]